MAEQSTNPACLQQMAEIYGPLVWFATFTALHNLLPNLFLQLLALRQDEELVQIVDEGEGDLGLDDQKSFARQEQARFRRASNFFTAPAACGKLIGVSLALTNAVHVLNAGFCSARRFKDAGTNILTFIHEPSNPALAVVRRHCEHLRNEDADFWQPMRNLGPWTEQLYLLAQPMWVEMAQLFVRLVLAFRAFPWRLGLLVVDEVSAEDKQYIAQEVLDQCVHAHPFLLKHREGLRTTADVLSAQNLRRIRDLFDSIPVTNIISEAAFAGSHTRRMANHGNDPSPPTLASNHILASSMTCLQAALEKQRRPMLAPRHQPPARCAWHAFMQKRRATLSLAQCAETWRGMSADERAEWAPRPLGAAPAAPLPPESPCPWPCCGDDIYPMSCEALKEVAPRVGDLSKAWQLRIGDSCVEPAPPFEAPPPHFCEQMIGRGLCVETTAADEYRALDVVFRRFNRWSSIFKAPPTAYDGAWTSLPLLYIGPRPGAAAGSGGLERGLAALFLFKQRDAQLFYVEEVHPPVLGSVIRFAPVWTNLRTRLWLGHRWASKVGWAGFRVKPKLIGLCSYEVEAVDELSQIELEHARRAAQAAEAKAMGGAVREQTSKRRRVRKSPPDGPAKPKAAGLAKPKEASAGEADAGADVVEGADGDAAVFVAFDAEVAEDPELGDGGGEEMDHFMGEDAREMSDAEAAAAAAPAGEGLPDSSSEEEHGDGDGPPLPIYEAATGYVFSAARPGVKLGRISIIKEGTPGAAISLYCRRHGCTIMKGVKFSPGLPALLEWFRAGEEIEIGRAGHNVNKHRRLFPK